MAFPKYLFLSETDYRGLVVDLIDYILSLDEEPEDIREFVKNDLKGILEAEDAYGFIVYDKEKDKFIVCEEDTWDFENLVDDITKDVEEGLWEEGKIRKKKK